MTLVAKHYVVPMHCSLVSLIKKFSSGLKSFLNLEELADCTFHLEIARTLPAAQKASHTSHGTCSSGMQIEPSFSNVSTLPHRRKSGACGDHSQRELQFLSGHIQQLSSSRKQALMLGDLQSTNCSMYAEINSCCLFQIKPMSGVASPGDSKSCRSPGLRAPPTQAEIHLLFLSFL
ncbi:uncharacterized protein [Dermacentor albipictus]|uniref:uncharacterized protein isoform X1 n=1 Tax=Dermacentor albipictus TaxID=60249 RepID=UPI0038FC956F